MPTKTRKKNAPKLDVYQAVTDQIIAALEQGVVPWRRPWTTSAAGVPHQNIASGTIYRGINPFLLEVAAMTHGYSSPYWLTFKQARDLGYKQWLKDEERKNSDENREYYDKNVFGYGVRKGETAPSLVTFWKSIRITEKNAKTGKDEAKSIPLLKYFKVFNVEQCDNLGLPEQPEPEPFEVSERAQEIIDGMPDAPKLFHRGSRAFYSPMMDTVTLPQREDFTTPDHYYGTAYHELVHSTGHESRLHRIKDWASFGSEPYAQEELVAEMGAAMLCGVAGVQVPIEHSASYLANWLTKLRDDKKFVVMAASKAQKAADFILGVTYENGES